MSKKRSGSAPRTCATAPDGTKLCKCGCGRPVGKGRSAWHSEACVHEWKIRNQPQYARQQVYIRDRGICAECGVDAEREEQRYRNCSAWEWVRRHDRANSWHWRHRYRAPVPEFLLPRNDRLQWHSRRVQDAIKRRIERMKSEDWSLLSTSWWQADHIVPVVEGGGQCGLENLRTLCERCHRKATKELRARLKLRRKT